MSELPREPKSAFGHRHHRSDAVRENFPPPDEPSAASEFPPAAPCLRRRLDAETLPADRRARAVPTAAGRPLVSSVQHPSKVPRLISRWSQARAVLQSRATVFADTPSTSADSWKFKPPKKRSSTTCALRASIRARALSALSR